MFALSMSVVALYDCSFFIVYQNAHIRAMYASVRVGRLGFSYMLAKLHANRHGQARTDKKGI